MENGRNIAPGSRKGGRSYIHLRTTRYRLELLTRLMEQRYAIGSVLEVGEDDLHDLFGGMRTGRIGRIRDGRPYRATGDYVKVFKAFWHWHMRTSRKNGVEVPDICVDLDTRCEKPPWVYLTQDDVNRLCRRASFKYRVLMTFLLDSGIRSPTELCNLLASDFSADCRELRIRDEISKTVGRTIKLLLSGELVADYIAANGLKPEDPVFRISPANTNRYLRLLAAEVLGHEVSRGGSSYSKLSLYDFRHSSACFWLPRYPSESALKYRFGWKESSMIHYYTGLIGMRDTITEVDLESSAPTGEPAVALEKANEENELLKAQLRLMSGEMRSVQEQVKEITLRLSQQG